MAIKRAVEDEIIGIGIVNGVEVNAYYSGIQRNVPVIEVLCNGRLITFSIAQAQGLLDLVEEALGFWREEAHT